MNLKNQGASILLWSLAVISAVAAEQQAIQGPGCQREECVPVSDCPQLRDRLLESPTEESFKEIRRLTCFIRKWRPWICCPPALPPRPTPPKLTQSLLPNDCGFSSYVPVAEGEEVPLNSYPWNAVLQYKDISKGKLNTDRVHCSGSVINDRYVLVPAQCAFKNLTVDRGLELVEVLVGEWDTSTDPDCTNGSRRRHACAPPVQRFAVEEVTLHPDFFARGVLSDDLALLRLRRPIDFKAAAGFIRPVCLPRVDSPAEVVLADGAILTSWNATSHRPRNHILSYVDKATCDKVLRDTFVNEQICMQVAQGPPDFSAVRGGPLMVYDAKRYSYTQFGILIGKSRNSDILPGLFTYIPPYVQWIEETLRP